MAADVDGSRSEDRLEAATVALIFLNLSNDASMTAERNRLPLVAS
jgi:hypothetical protein